VVEAARALSQGLYKRANSFVSGVFQFALHGVITLFSIFYLLMQGRNCAPSCFACRLWQMTKTSCLSTSWAKWDAPS